MTLGTWKLAAFEAYSPERKEPDPAAGWLIYTADGHMSAGVMRERPGRPAMLASMVRLTLHLTSLEQGRHR